MMYVPFFGLALHMLFSLALLVGLTCGVIWLARFATKEQLKRWFKWLFLIGLLGALLTGVWAHRSMYRMMERWDGKEGEGYDDEDYGSMGDFMKDMMDWNDEDDKNNNSDPSETMTTPVEDSNASTTQSSTAPENSATDTSSTANTSDGAASDQVPTNTDNTSNTPGNTSNTGNTTDNTTNVGGNANVGW